MHGPENPYASPTAGAVPSATNRRLALRRLRPPAIGLLVSAILSLGMFALNLLSIAIMLARGLDELANDQLRFWSAYGQAYALMILSSTVVIYAAIQMLRGRQYAACMMGIILAAIPFCSPVCVLGVPFAIWAGILLSGKDTRAAFEEATDPS
jgi:hypothetical protein